MVALGGFSRVLNTKLLSAVQDWRLERKWSAVGFCSGAIAGLVAITPASGFVGAREFGLSTAYHGELILRLAIAAALAFGAAAGTFCNFATQLKCMTQPSCLTAPN
jgi:hypothetical protein